MDAESVVIFIFLIFCAFSFGFVVCDVVQDSPELAKFSRQNCVCLYDRPSCDLLYDHSINYKEFESLVNKNE